MLKYEFIYEDTPFGMKFKTKVIDKRTGEEFIFRSIVDIPLDEPLCEIIEEFGIPIFRKKGLNYKIRYIARKHLELKLNIIPQKFRYHEDRIVWIHDREVLTKKEYKAQKLGETQFPLTFHPSLPILYSLGDAIQILSRIQTEAKKAKLIRRLIIKIEELQKKLNKHNKEDIEAWYSALKQLDDICYSWIKEHREAIIYKGKEVSGYYAGYIRLWDEPSWQLIIDAHIRIKTVLDLPIPTKKNTGLHHSDRPYRKVYPHIATRGKLIDKRFGHEDPRQKRFY